MSYRQKLRNTGDVLTKKNQNVGDDLIDRNNEMWKTFLQQKIKHVGGYRYYEILETFLR